MKNKKNNEELQSRRQFFKQAAKGALPIIAATVLASAPAIVKAAESTGCQWGCSGSCYGLCNNSCRGYCSQGCTGTCSGSCKATCQSQCNASSGYRW